MIFKKEKEKGKSQSMFELGKEPLFFINTEEYSKLIIRSLERRHEQVRRLKPNK